MWKTMKSLDVATVFICYALTLLVVGAVNVTTHQRMLARLVDPQYQSSVRPNSEGAPVTVEVDMVLISVGPVNEMDMTWTASFYFRQQWTDGRLILDESGGTTVKIDGSYVNQLWRPDLFFSNNKEGRKHDLTVPNHLVYVNSSSGNILYSQRLTVVFNCEMDLSKFPHDNQTCHLNMESYSFTTSDLVLQWSSSRAATSLLPTAYIPDFHIKDISTYDCTATYAIGTYPCLRATLRMNREIGFYIFQTYLPSILIVVLSWASFWINHEAVPARISVGLLTVLTITTQLSGSRAQLPRVPYIKAIDVWMSTNLVFVFAAYMEYAVVTVLSRKYKKRKVRQPYTTQEDLASSQDDDGTGFQPVSTVNGSAGKTPNVQSSAPRPPPPPPSTHSDDLDSRDTGRRVDKMSRFLFPLAFTIFNIVYWVYYMLVA